MITLITGGNGHGKTALAVSMALQEKGRPLFVVGIKDLKISHEQAPPLAEWTHYVEDPTYVGGRKLAFTFPPNSLIIIDECQSIYRPRAAASKVPDHVAAFETHRHEGLDFWLITQDPGLLDGNVRRLVRRHIHLRDTWMGRKLIEWPELGDPDSRVSRELAAQRSYRLPKHAFNLYTSAQVHTKLAKRTPWYVYLFAISLVIFFGTMFYIYRTIQSKLQPPADALPIGTTVQGGKGVSGKITRAGWLEDREPRIKGVAFTAPVYDKVTEPKVAPFPSACGEFKGECRCYTDQATRLYLPEWICRDIVANGLFKPWHEEKVGGAYNGPQIAQNGPQRVPDAPVVQTPGLPDREAIKLSPDAKKALPPDQGPPRQHYPPKR